MKGEHRAWRLTPAGVEAARSARLLPGFRRGFTELPIDRACRRAAREGLAVFVGADGALTLATAPADESAG